MLFRISEDGAGRPQFITVYQNGTPLTYVYDGLGNVVGLVDDNSSNSTYNQEVVTYSYDAWGNVLSETDNSGIGLAKTNPLLYKGYWYEWSTGLYYLNARYYNPAWGRFISKDALGVQPGDAASYNEYEYAANNPVSFSDPTGYMPVALPGVPNNPNLPAQVVHKEVMQQYLQYLGYLSFLQELSDGLSAAALAASGVALACGGDTLATLPAAEVGVLEATGACTAGALLWADGSAIGSGAVVTLMDVQRARYGQGSWTQVWLDSSGVLFSILGFASPGLSADDPVNAQVLHMIAEKLSAISWGWSLHNRSSTP